jgi:cytochrome c oxidase cbb3-type subunit 3
VSGHAALATRGVGAYCVACHGDGSGVIDNLTDALDPVAPDAIYATTGRTKGMPAWGQSLKPDEVSAVVAYVISLQGTTPATPKPPEGTADTAAAPPPSGS